MARVPGWPRREHASLVPRAYLDLEYLNAALGVLFKMVTRGEKFFKAI